MSIVANGMALLFPRKGAAGEIRLKKLGMRPLPLHRRVHAASASSEFARTSCELFQEERALWEAAIFLQARIVGQLHRLRPVQPPLNKYRSSHSRTAAGGAWWHIGTAAVTVVPSFATAVPAPDCA